jgi:hypothetical protein
LGFGGLEVRRFGFSVVRWFGFSVFRKLNIEYRISQSQHRGLGVWSLGGLVFRLFGQNLCGSAAWREINQRIGVFGYSYIRFKTLRDFAVKLGET